MGRLERLRPDLAVFEKKEDFYDGLSFDEKKVYLFAQEAHKGQKRVDGADYFDHVVEVARILKDELGETGATLMAGLLHDVVEDTEITIEQIQNEFGDEVAKLVDGVTNLELVGIPKDLRDIKDLQRILIHVSKDIRVLKIKLADRLHNIKSLAVMPAEKRVKKARETLRIYVVAAREMGLWHLAGNLADEAFGYAFPNRAAGTKKEVDADPRMNVEFLNVWIDSIESYLKLKGIKANVECEVSGYYQVYEKRQRILALEGKAMRVADLTDLVSIRVVLEEGDEAEIMQVVGVLMGGFGGQVDFAKTKDYISQTSGNGYRAFHLVVSDTRSNLPIEVAIANKEMERFNREGRREEVSVPTMVLDKDGVMHVFPAGSRMIDFVYRVASDPFLVGATMVDDQLVEHDYVLKSGDWIRYENKDCVRPGDDMEFLHMANRETRNKILARKRNNEEGRLMTVGTQLLENIMARFGLLRIEDLGIPMRLKVLAKLNRPDLAGLYREIGMHGEARAVEVAKVTEEVITDYGLKGLVTLVVDKISDQPGVLSLVNRIVADYGVNVLRQIAKTGPGEVPRIRMLIENCDAKCKERIREEVTMLGIGEVKVFG